jgi:hypothetical protein
MQAGFPAAEMTEIFLASSCLGKNSLGDGTKNKIVITFADYHFLCEEHLA